ncbi:MAG: 16S rRNA (uracil(1498)-N(3))-methyltransferase [Halomonadaceae bacterium]|nr:MAG: 16S rRNA (uracil(1498)-N(3))-methyltransferase [Halomonadaceae bacterium]
MNQLLLGPADLLSPDRARVTGRPLAHLRSIRHLAVGDCFAVGIIDGNQGQATVVSLADDHAELALDCQQPPPAPLPLTLILAMPRPKMLRRVIQTLVAMGVKELVLINSTKVEKSYWQTPRLGADSLAEQITLGLEQAKDTVWPRIQLRQRFKPFVEDELGTLAADSLKLIAHPGTSTPCPRALAQPATLCIGPEGGFTDYEVALIEAQGFTPVHLGPRILRVENAVPALLARLF